MSYPQPLRSLQINRPTSPKNKFLIVGRKGQLGTTNHQDPDSWTYEPFGIINHLLPMVEVRSIYFLVLFCDTGFSPAHFLVIPVLVRHPFTKISSWLLRVV